MTDWVAGLASAAQLVQEGAAAMWLLAPDFPCLHKRIGCRAATGACMHTCMHAQWRGRGSICCLLSKVADEEERTLI